MKKYLMSLAAIALVSSAFVSCSKNDELYNPSQAQVDKAKYEQAFLAYVGGKIAPSQDWGFSTTRSVDVNGNLWESQPEWTVAERNAVYAYVNRLKKDIPAGTYTEEDPTNLKNFFVTQIWGGKQDDPNCLYLNIDQIRQQKAGRTYQNSEKIWGASKMNHLCISKDATRLGTGVAAVDAANWDHANNFNRADNTDWGGNTMFVDWGSLNFAYMSSEDSKYHDKWIIVDGQYITDADGVNHAGQYYVCFDFISTNPNLKTKFRMKYPNPVRPTEMFERGPIMVQGEFTTVAEAAGIEVEVDGKKFKIGEEGTEWWIEGYDGDANMSIPANDYYTDWIIRLVEAKPKAEQYDLRIIAEDLTAAQGTDFDFNDVVIDVKYGNPAKLRLMAAGGTLPLRINGDDTQEVHKLFGVWPADYQLGMGDKTEANPKPTLLPMVNTGAGPEVDPVVLTGITINIQNAAQANDLKLEVYKNGKWELLTAPKGEPSCKLAVDTDYVILPEYQSIKGAYPLFVEWANVNNPNLSKWW